ncbi:hypothetical protein [Ferrimicrobium sp.]|uniref:hypothetical protein n=1 Tax=Ferrimicrobium sp. TaxID=2926050 RepID=UPI00260FD4F5|nr:hypothetical protein [Ferrimicrobium sp.]
MIGDLCSLIVIGAVVAELLRNRRPRAEGGLRLQQAIPVLLMVSVIALVLSPIIGLLAGLAALTIVIVDTSHSSEKLAFALSGAWALVLDETATRISSLGDPLPSAFFGAAHTLPGNLVDYVDEGAKIYQLTGDFQGALGPLSARLPFGSSTETLKILASLTSLSTAEAQTALGVLAERHREDHNLTLELQAKLSGAKLARAFVVAVPLFLLLIGIIIGGGVAAYLTPLGLTMGTIALIIITLCWLWADHYLTPLERSRTSTRRQSPLFWLLAWSQP